MGIIGNILGIVVFVIVGSAALMNPSSLFTAKSFALITLGATFFAIPRVYEFNIIKFLGWLIMFSSCYAISGSSGAIIVALLLVYFFGYFLAGLPWETSRHGDSGIDFDFRDNSGSGGGDSGGE